MKFFSQSKEQFINEVTSTFVLYLIILVVTAITTTIVTRLSTIVIPVKQIGRVVLYSRYSSASYSFLVSFLHPLLIKFDFPLGASGIRAILHNGEKVVVKVQRPSLKKLFDIDLRKYLSYAKTPTIFSWWPFKHVLILVFRFNLFHIIFEIFVI